MRAWVFGVVVLGPLLAISGCSDEEHGNADAGGAGSAGQSATGGSAGSSGGSGGSAGDGGMSGGTAGTGGSPLGECGSVVDCAGELCVDPENPECSAGGCLMDGRGDAVPEFYCTKACGTPQDCPSGFVCEVVNVAGGGEGSYCVRYRPACGNGTQDPEEACDDGNEASGDGCSADCLSDESCGNGVEDPDEACDDGNEISGDGCSADCLSDESCGNGMTDAGEDCDDGNTTGADGCEPDCTITGCGNAHPTEPEACDEELPGCDDECRVVPVDGTSDLNRYPGEVQTTGSVLAATGTGANLFVTWVDPGPVRVALTSADGGAHFQTRQTLTLTGDSTVGGSARILRGTTGNTLVLWLPRDRELLMRRSTNLGVSWTAEETASVPTLESSDYVDMVAAGSSYYLTWRTRSGTNDSYWVSRSSDAGATWGASVAVDLPQPQGACSANGIAADAAGHVLVKTCLGARVSDDFGATFEDVTVTGDLTEARVIDAPRALEISAGVWIAPSWIGTAVFRTTDGFSTWTASNLVTGTGGTGTVVRRPDGTLYWAWGGAPTPSASNSSMFLRRSSDGGVTWDAAVTVATFPSSVVVGTGIVSSGDGAFVWWVGIEEGSTSLNGSFRGRNTADGVTSDAAISLSRPRNTTWAPKVLLTGGDGTGHAFWVESTTQTPAVHSVRHRSLAP